MFPLKFLSKIKFGHVVFLYLVVATVATIQCYYGYIISPGPRGKIYANYNNYVLFRNSFFHLIQGKDLYIPYPEEQWDLFKYSPTFSLLFGLLAHLPDFIGLFIWNLVNTIPLLIAFRQLRGFSANNKVYALLFCLIELANSLQNSQSNGLMAALLILTFTSLESRRYFLAAFIIGISIYLKIYGGVGIVLYLFYPSKARLFGYTIFWIILLAILPLLVIDFNQLVYLYKSWDILLKADRQNSTGISVMGILLSWFHSKTSKNIIVAIGIILFFLPLSQIRKYRYYDFRLLALSSTLIWIVIFNHKAESPTYIISVCGIAIWFFSQAKTRINIILVILAFIFTSIASGDLFPYFVKEEFIRPFQLKALFSIIIFGKISYELFTRQFHDTQRIQQVTKVRA